jgi:hypothetical protein
LLGVVEYGLPQATIAGLTRQREVKQRAK